jgi:tetratricopeptide (TPR) repeat protein
MSTGGEASPSVVDLAVLENPSRALFDQTVSRLDAAMADTVRTCAIPRSIDAAVVAVLRDVPADDPGNAAVVDLLAGLPFVSARRDGRLVFDESVRDPLLEEWRAEDGALRDRFEELSTRLVAHFEGEHDAAIALEGDLLAVADVMRAAHLERYTQLAALIQQRTRDALIDALYHEMLRSSEAGYQFAERMYAVHERNMRFTICAALVGEAQLQLGRLYPAQEAAPRLLWLRYWDARLIRALNRFEDAEADLRALDAQTGDDVRLHLWVAAELGAVLQEQFKLGEAIEVSLAEALEANETQIDAWNISVSYIRLGSLYQQVDDLDKALDCYGRAVDQAREVGNEHGVVYGLLGRAATLSELGDVETALGAALEALDIARTTMRESRDVQLAVVSAAMNLVATLDPPLLDTTRHEARELAATMGDPIAALEVDRQYVERLREGGRMRRAWDVHTTLREQAAIHQQPAFDYEVLVVGAQLHEDRGELEEAVAVYTQMDGGEATAWSRAAALSNRGRDLTRLGRLEAATADLEAAREGWRWIGNDKLETLMGVWLADVEARQGRPQRAHELLDAAEPLLAQSRAWYLGDLLTVRSETLASEGRADAAARTRVVALERQRAHHDLRAQARSMARLAVLHSHRGEWRESADWSHRAAEQSARIAERDAYVATEQVRTADTHAAQAANLFSEAASDPRDGLRRARDQLRSATEAAPDNFWLSLNLAYAHGALGEWRDATEALETALEVGPDLLDDVAVLHRRRAEYRASEGQRLFADEAHEEAARVFDESRAVLAGHVDDALLAGFAISAGDSLFKIGRRPDARTRYQDGASLLAPDSPDLTPYESRFGVLAALDGDATAAAGHFRRAIELGGGNADLLWQLVELSAVMVGAEGAPAALQDALTILIRDPEIGGQMTTFTSQVALPLPEGWVGRETIAIQAPDGQANVIASSEPIAPETTGEAYAELVGRSLVEQELPGYREVSFERADEGDHWLRTYEWEPPESPSITQTQLYYVDDGRGYTVTATMATSERARYELELGLLLRSLIGDRG